MGRRERHPTEKIARGAVITYFLLHACSSDISGSTSVPEEFPTQPIPTETFTPTQTPEPFSLMQATPMELVQAYVPPLNPPEYEPLAAGGAFPEYLQQEAERARYIALEIQKRHDEGSFELTEEEYYRELDEFQRTRGYEVKQVWSRDPDNSQVVTTLVRQRNEIEEVRWFVTSGGAFPARPDGLPEGEDPRNPTQVWVPLAPGHHAEFIYNSQDQHFYMFEVDNQTRQADRWFSPVQASAFIDRGIEGAFEPVIDPLESGLKLPGIERVEEVNGRLMAYTELGYRPKFEFNFETGEWEDFVPKVGKICQDAESPYVWDCDLASPEMYKPIEEERIKPLYTRGENGQLELLPLGRVPELDQVSESDTGRVEWKGVSCVVKGIIPWPHTAYERTVKALCEVITRIGDSQFFFITITDQPGLNPAHYYMRNNVVQDRFKKPTSYEEVLNRFYDPRIINQQVLFAMKVVSDLEGHQAEPIINETHRMLIETIEGEEPFDREGLYEGAIYKGIEFYPEWMSR